MVHKYRFIEHFWKSFINYFVIEGNDFTSANHNMFGSKF